MSIVSIAVSLQIDQIQIALRLARILFEDAHSDLLDSSNAPRHGARYSAAERSRLLRLHSEEQPLATIANDLGRTQHAVAWQLISHAHPPVPADVWRRLAAGKTAVQTGSAKPRLQPEAVDDTPALREWLPKEDAALVQRYEAGQSFDEMANGLHIPESDVVHRLVDIILDRRGHRDESPATPNKTHVRISQVLDGYRAGKSVRQIARDLECPRDTVGEAVLLALRPPIPPAAHNRLARGECAVTSKR